MSDESTATAPQTANAQLQTCLVDMCGFTEPTPQQTEIVRELFLNEMSTTPISEILSHLALDIEDEKTIQTRTFTLTIQRPERTLKLDGQVVLTWGELRAVIENRQQIPAAIREDSE
tara:strand:+ start:497 stop:847 length:351 start_codon:yes stop_codon:yes gene_type:complete